MLPADLLAGDLALFFLIGLLGGAHCIGMCGPLVTIYAGRLDERSETREGLLGPYEVRQHALFNVGRTVGYAAIGGLFGLLGGTLYVTTGAITPLVALVRGSVGVLIGLFVVAVGLYYLAGRTGGMAARLPGFGFGRVQSVLTSRVDRWVDGPGIVGLGTIHALLPCPILYPAFLYAFTTGSAVRGISLLAALGVGTIPAVFLYGTVVESVSPASRQRLHRALGALFVVLGSIPLLHGLAALGVPVPHVEIPIYQPLGGAHG
ncbi:MAG: sulfite exporter TauE/SafE family protein [Haloarculaceae archaeon]